MSTKIETINHDITTKEGWEALLEQEATITHERYSREEQKLATVLLYLERDPRTEIPFPSPRVIGLLSHFASENDDEGQAAKVAFEMIVRATAVIGRAVASIFTSEVWILQTTDPDERANHDGPVRTHPKRQEAVVMTAAHRSLEGRYSSAIIHVAGSVRTVEPFRHEGSSKLLAMGRFASFVPPASIMDNPMNVAMARLYLEHHAKELTIIEPPGGPRAEG